MARVAGAEVGFHGGSDFGPEVGRTFLMDAFITEHGELASIGGDKEEHGVTLGRLVHLELGEFLGGGRSGVVDFAGLEHDTDFAGSA